MALSQHFDGEVSSGPHVPCGSVRVCDIGGEQLDGPFFLVSAGTANDWTANRGAACPVHAGRHVPLTVPRTGALTGYAAAMEIAAEREAHRERADA